MKKNELYILLKKLSEGFIDKKIDPNLFSFVVEGLIAYNKSIVPELEELSDVLSQFHEPRDEEELYTKEQIIKLLKLKFDIG